MACVAGLGEGGGGYHFLHIVDSLGVGVGGNPPSFTERKGGEDYHALSPHPLVS
jgi:hypothetical protein